jgi:hypothetical protein
MSCSFEVFVFADSPKNMSTCAFESAGERNFNNIRISPINRGITPQNSFYLRDTERFGKSGKKFGAIWKTDSKIGKRGKVFWKRGGFRLLRRSTLAISLIIVITGISSLACFFSLMSLYQEEYIVTEEFRCGYLACLLFLHERKKKQAHNCFSHTRQIIRQLTAITLLAARPYSGSTAGRSPRLSQD